MTKKIWIVLTLMMVLPAMTLDGFMRQEKNLFRCLMPSLQMMRRERARKDALARQRAFDEQQLKDQAAGRAGGAGEQGWIQANRQREAVLFLKIFILSMTVRRLFLKHGTC